MIMPRMRDPALYENPNEYDGYRFLRLRQEEGGEKVSTCILARHESNASTNPTRGRDDLVCESNGLTKHILQTAQLVATAVDFPAFGYGRHGCPGRFFAAHEVKLVICHLLLKYDWKLVDGADEPRWRANGNGLECDGLAKIAIRRRDTGEEVPL